jgi:hypothetical protein
MLGAALLGVAFAVVVERVAATGLVLSVPGPTQALRRSATPAQMRVFLVMVLPVNMVQGSRISEG